MIGTAISYLIPYIIGIFVGMLWVNTMRKIKASGTIKIDSSDPEKDVYHLEVNNLSDFNKKKYIVLKVEKNADLSQK